MKARTKITVWTASFTLLVAIIFSGFVLYEFMEQPFRLIDRELRDIRDLVLLEVMPINFVAAKELTGHPYDRYWLKVFDQNDRTVLQTPMTKHVEIKSRENDRFYFEKKEIALENIWIAEEDRDELDEIAGKPVFFRVFQDIREVDSVFYKVHIGRPIPILAQEMTELVVEILCWIVLCVILVVLASYHLSGKILKPLSNINLMIQEITDASLSKRIPVGQNRDELDSLSLSLNNMFDRLQCSFDRQKEYIGDASHELKSPLTILMLAQEKMLSESLPENVKTGIEKQLDTLRRLSKLVRNLLEISRLEQHESFKREPVDLETIIIHVVEEFEELLIARDIQVNTSLKETSFLGDSDKILQVLINLLDNAIKYNLLKNGQIWIVVKDVGANAVLSISNTGLPIPGESLAKIFDQFYRVEKSRATLFGGSGLGLTIVKQIVKLHDASIEATSDSKGITQILIKFPSRTL